MAQVIPTFIIDELIEERKRTLLVLEEEALDKPAARVTSEISRLEEAKARADDWADLVPTVARMFGYTPGHIYRLIRDHVLEDVSGEGENKKVRYMDVLRHRLQDPPEQEEPVRPPPPPKHSAPRRNGARRRGVGVTVLN